MALARRLRVDLAGAAYLVGLSPSQRHTVHAAFPGGFDLVTYEPMQPSDLEPVREGGEPADFGPGLRAVTPVRTFG